MSDNSKFWLGVWVLIVCGVGIITTGVVFVNNNNNNLFSDLVDKGFSPMEAKCSQMSSTQMAANGPCMVLAVKKLLPEADGTKTY